MDDEEDSIALRMKRNERRINQQSDELILTHLSFHFYIYILFTGSKILLNK